MNTAALAIAAKSKNEKGGLIPNRIRELDWLKLAKYAARPFRVFRPPAT
jgi:hypothetical protein